MKYDVNVLESMIENMSDNIAMFQRLGVDKNEEKIADMVKYRRGLAALVENEGEPMSGVTVDSMVYAASLPGADTSWWTKGT